MKTIRNYVSVGLWMVLFLLAACKKDDPQPKGEFSTGVVVVNEGNFHSSDGTLSFFNPSDGTVQQDIFGLKNNGLALGDVVQSMTVEGDIAYVVVNNDNKMEIANSNTMVSQHTLTGLAMPRYFTVFNGKGYVTEWVSFTSSGQVSVINLQSYAIETSIVTDYGAENIIATGNKLYVSNSFSNTVSVIDPAQNKVVNTITVSNSPGGFVTDKENKLWVLCGGGYDANGPLLDGALVRINVTTDAVEKTILLGKNLTAKVTLNHDRDKLYYFDEQHVYEVKISDTAGPSSAFITESAAVNFYGIGMDPVANILYVGDAKGFTGNGTVYRYSSTGAPVGNFTVGRGPNGFVFR